ncbi:MULTISPECIES: carbohydrate ABC transporter permease [unclassified Paenibacillus]|uniref:carbohydrate ABC transporter permease n=1 Tax=unclassified Paenibacillus TaxID=185978 RepID=UPI0004F65101|nr:MULTISPECIES: carbohydrate ABC transporter permease [unclassified Paenibacillus]AIQ48444.1 ABC transporter permease [Paenibacillus sp. FSL R7-0273]AIQ53933.1 ABC transporter permease [Paenibacillus sp. FSL R7-0331]OMF88407.1 ABC transporter permease [Paenibacillus sp. FSL R7-0273]
MYHKSKGYKIFSFFNYIFLILIALSCFLPMLHLLAQSLSSKSAINGNLVSFWPVDFNMDAYAKTFRNTNFTGSMQISVFRTVLGTLISMFVITTAGYALSKDFRGRNVLMWIFIFTMLFSGGLIPSYILVTKLGFKDTIWSLVLPGAFGAYNLILIMNFFKTIPKALEEAAFIDGASFFVIFRKIYLPLSLPGLATVGLFIMVGHWNAWFDGILYMSSTENYPLASFLQTVVVQGSAQSMALSQSEAAALSEQSIKAAQIFISTLPIILVYPFLQKYFVKGIVLGAVKE